MFRTQAENIEFVKHEQCGIEWCECISDMLEDLGFAVTPEKVWNSSQTSELSAVFELARRTREYWTDGDSGHKFRTETKARFNKLDAEFKGEPQKPEKSADGPVSPDQAALQPALA